MMVNLQFRQCAKIRCNWETTSFYKLSQKSNTQNGVENIEYRLQLRRFKVNIIVF